MPLPNRFYRDYKRLARQFCDGAVFTAIDTETTSLRPDSGNIIEIGAVQFDRNGILETFSQLINPGGYIPPQITAITGITPTMVSDKPAAAVVLPAFLRFIGKTIVVGHNINFDLSFIHEELVRSGISGFTNSAVDTLWLSRIAYPEFSSYKLQSLAEQLNIHVQEAHRALDDARVCMDLFFLCFKKLGVIEAATANQTQMSLF